MTLTISPHLWLALLTTVTAAACGTDDADPALRFAGRLDGTNALVYASIDGDKVNVHLCDGTDAAKATLYAWFEGTTATESAQLPSDSGNATLDVSFGADATGTIAINGTSHSFTAPPIDGDLGLYRGATTVGADTFEFGTILLSANDQRGAILQNNSIMVIAVAVSAGQTSVSAPGAGVIAVSHVLGSFTRH